MFNWNTSKKDIGLIRQIVDRVAGDLERAKFGWRLDKVGLSMDIEVAHWVCPIDLEGLLKADRSDFYHDVNGIAAHLDRRRHDLTDGWAPRYSRRPEPIDIVGSVIESIAQGVMADQEGR